MKYAGLMVGAFSLCRDERDITVAIAGGLAYVVGDVTGNRLRRYEDEIREERLKEHRAHRSANCISGLESAIK